MIARRRYLCWLTACYSAYSYTIQLILSKTNSTSCLSRLHQSQCRLLLQDHLLLQFDLASYDHDLEKCLVCSSSLGCPAGCASPGLDQMVQITDAAAVQRAKPGLDCCHSQLPLSSLPHTPRTCRHVGQPMRRGRPPSAQCARTPRGPSGPRLSATGLCRCWSPGSWRSSASAV